MKRSLVLAVLLAGCSVTSPVDDERSRCVESGRIALVREVAGRVVVTACLTVEEIERVGS